MSQPPPASFDSKLEWQEKDKKKNEKKEEQAAALLKRIQSTWQFLNPQESTFSNNVIRTTNLKCFQTSADFCKSWTKHIPVV